MIRKLVRTEIESSYRDLVLFFLSIFAALFLIFFFFALEPASDDAPDPIDVFRTIFMLAALFSSLVTGVRVFVRQSREKRIRLFSQLPVSNHEVSVASWCFILLCIGIPTSAWMIYLLFEDSSTAHYLQVARATIAFFLTIVTLIASISVVMSIFKLPVFRNRKWIYSILTVSLVVLISTWVHHNDWDAVLNAIVGRGEMLPVILFLAFSSAGLVLGDIWLRNRSDNYLG
jgi:hypothetical protein